MAATIGCDSQTGGEADPKVDTSSVMVDTDGDGTVDNPLDPSTPYRIMCNSFLADGGDGFSVFTEDTEPPLQRPRHRRASEVRRGAQPVHAERDQPDQRAVTRYGRHDVKVGAGLRRDETTQPANCSSPSQDHRGMASPSGTVAVGSP